MLIGITGKKGHGKNFFGGVLQKLLYESNEIEIPSVSFADPLKRFMCLNFGWERKHTHGALKEIECQTKEIVLEDLISSIARFSYGSNMPISVEDSEAQVMKLWKSNFPEEYHKATFQMKISPRELAQTLGTEVMRSIYPNAHLDKLPLKGVVTDVRFDNEADLIKSQGGMVIEVVGRGDCVPELSFQHVSENGISSDKVDLIVHNYYHYQGLVAYAREFVIPEIQNHYGL